MKKLLILILSLMSVFTFSQIAHERIVDWSVAGLKEVIPEPLNLIDVTDYGLVGDSLTDNSAAFQTAIVALEGNAGVLFFPEGKYSFRSTIEIPANVIIRGEGSDKTRFFFDLGDQAEHCILISENQSEAFTRVYSGFEKGSDTLILQSSIEFNPGEFAEMRQDNGVWDSNPADWAKKVVGQILHIDRQNEDTLFLEHPLRLDFDTALNLEVRKIDPVKNVVLECFYMERIDEPVSAGSNIYVDYAANCRISGVESNVSSGAHIYINASTNIWVEGSYIHHSINYDGIGTNGYGIMLNNHSGECLIENNIFRFLRHAMMVKTGANGNVFAYNYAIEPNRSETFSALSGDISLHGHYAFANLFEGNVVQNIILDHFWGPSGPYNTIFRNRVELYGILFYNDGPILSTDQNVVGNEVPNTLTPYGQYQLFGANHFEYGNNVQGTNIPVSTTDLSNESYFYSEEPDYWDDVLNWPPIGYPNALNAYKIPAQLRYESASGFTLCPESQIRIDPDIDKDYLFKVYPNPFVEKLSVDLGFSTDEIIRLRVQNISGKTVFTWKVLSNNGHINLDYELSDLSPGIYILTLQIGQFVQHQKIIKK